MTDVVMPRLSDTMEEGTVLRWLKQDGEHVHRGEELVEIETDKAAMTYESDSDGVLQTIAREGDTLAVGEPIALIGSVENRSPGNAVAQAGSEAHEPGAPIGSEADEPGVPTGSKADESGPPCRSGRVKASP
jgi:pyruvate dehydrogenase E2 component (dihydrolipoamide acetyltransferase)